MENHAHTFFRLTHGGKWIPTVIGCCKQEKAYNKAAAREWAEHVKFMGNASLNIRD